MYPGLTPHHEDPETERVLVVAYRSAESLPQSTLDGGALRKSLPLLALTLWAYWGCLKNPFHFDDSLFLQSPQVTEPGDPLHFLKPSQSRQLFYLSLFMNYRLGGRNPGGYHLFNLILHLANALGIYLLARLLCRRKSDLSDSMVRRWLPFAAAGIFALHPIQSQAVNYVYQRSTLLAAFFTIAAICAFVWSEQTRRRGLFLLLAGIFFILAAASKESALILPLVLADLLLVLRKRTRAPPVVGASPADFS